MSIINTTPAAKTFTKLGTAIVTTVQPIANLIEMASESSLAWTQAHAADVAAKADRKDKVREQTNRDLLRQALIAADEATIETNNLERKVQVLVEVDAVKQRVHEAKCDAIKCISEETIQSLISKNNLTDADIMRAAKVGTLPIESDDNSDEPKSAFDMSRFTAK